ncbi:chloramphenicol O-acetyltransferase type A [Pseudoduganella lurida]|uniref:Chloramphenicol O-acetyltransferase type A n=1 Tax=Pseudoduganella lurida TaxID=1036180 RepID=A0A562R4Y0_9BURK|nr:CatA-like O-acetyltransferase [Pseudoduganella lurida]TWI63446.1 chloramphenicol O-acetyltransferase type A [Pseudoduganella lurida]
MEHFERRRDRFQLFDGMDSAAVNLCFTMELPDFRPWCREQGLPPFHVLLCAVLRSVLKIENFRYRVFEGEVIRVDALVPSFTVINQHNDLNFAMFDWSDDLRTFVARGVAAREQASGMTELNSFYRTLSPRAAKNQVFITCIPWLNFHSIQHPVAALDCPDIPSLAWGKFRDGAPGELLLPFSVQAHHGFVDGFHIHQLAQQIAEELRQIMAD